MVSREPERHLISREPERPVVVREERPNIVRDQRPVQVSAIPQGEVRANQVNFNQRPPSAAIVTVPAPVARAPEGVPVNRAMPLSEMRKVESIEVGRPNVGFTQPQATQPLIMEKKVSVPTPVSTLNDKPSFGEKVTTSEQQQSFSNPPQVVESVNFSRPVERTATSKIMENLQGEAVAERQGDSLVTSVPGGYNENKLQQ